MNVRKNMKSISARHKPSVFIKNEAAGITLVALVVTIVVLLILSGITLNLTLGSNGIIKRAVETRDKSKIADQQTTLQMAVVSVMMDGNLTKERLAAELDKSIAGKYTISDPDENGVITVSFTGGKSFTVDANGKVELAGPSVQVANVKVVDSNGQEVETNTAAAGTRLYIKFTASIEDGEIISVKYGETTLTPTSEVYTQEITENGTYNFDIIGNVDGQEYPLTYTVPVTQYAKIELKATNIKDEAESIYGKYVTNYTAGWEYIKGVTEETKRESWKIFYADENNIYLIASNYIHYTGMPTIGANTANVTYTENNETKIYLYRGKFSNVKAGYSTGSSKVESSMQYLNANYYEYLASTSQTSNKNNMQSVAYMLDTSKWSNYASYTKNGVVDWAIGGPSLELLFASYKDKYPSSKLVAGSVEANKKTANTIKLAGYKYSTNGGSSWTIGTTALNNNDSLS